MAVSERFLQIVGGLGPLRLELGGTSEMVDRDIEVAALREHGAQMIVGFRVVVTAGQQRLEQADRFVGATAGVDCGRQQIAGCGMIRLRGEDLPVERDCLGEAPAAVPL